MAFEADSAQCPHSDLAFELRHVMMENSNVHYVEMSAACKVCGVPMQFRGMPFGVTPEHPTMAMDGSEVTLPLLGKGEEPRGNLTGMVGHPLGREAR